MRGHRAATGVKAASNPLARLEQSLGHPFQDRALLQQALTHRSFSSGHNERLEFLGDAVLGLAVSRLLIERFPNSDEGQLTRVRAHLVREGSLHQIALQLGLPEVLRMSEGEARSGGAQRASLLADALEALLGAVQLDAGFDAAQAVVNRLFGDVIARSEQGRWDKDPKTALQEVLQARRCPVPRYQSLAATGQAHAQTFEVACDVDSLGWRTTASGLSRRQAEQDAARLMLQRIQSAEPTPAPSAP